MNEKSPHINISKIEVSQFILYALLHHTPILHKEDKKYPGVFRKKKKQGMSLATPNTHHCQPVAINSHRKA